MKTGLTELTSIDDSAGAAKPLTMVTIHNRKNQASQPITWAAGRAMNPRIPVRAPVIMMAGSAGRARNVASGPTREIMPK